jgi:ADP-L-glycero-D-manno-heptose 6-epimerase
MIIITGAAGFIGSCVAAGYNAAGRKDIVLVDDFSRADKARNHEDKECIARVHRDELLAWMRPRVRDIEAVIHLGARTDTAEQDWDLFLRLNLNYTQDIWRFCTECQIPLIYASSAATYGAGELGFEDSHAIIPQLKPLNPYGRSKNDFDVWALQQTDAPPFWAGLKFFNVYGPNEYHKGRMASVIFHAYRQIQEQGSLRLFRSHRPDFGDGKQLRDFIYVKDIVAVIRFLLFNQPRPGIYNLGTGQARSFLDLGEGVFHALGLPPQISFIDTPADIRDTYQYFTEAKMDKLLAAGYSDGFTSLEDGIVDYVHNFLRPQGYL